MTASAPKMKRDWVEEMIGRGEIIQLGDGQVGLAGRALGLFRYFSDTFARWARVCGAEERLYPSLIPAAVLGRSDYFVSFPQHATFVSCLDGDEKTLGHFTSAIGAGLAPGDAARTALSSPSNVLSSAVCYHCYEEFAGRQIPASGVVITAEERCFRFEGARMKPLCRQWEFTMREMVFLGARSRAKRWRQSMLERAVRFARELGFAGGVVTASDPFFGTEQGRGKALLQEVQELKYELRLAVEPPGSSLAVASFNLHHDYFGRAFDIRLSEGGRAASACAAFGLERWVYAALVQDRPRAALGLEGTS